MLEIIEKELRMSTRATTMSCRYPAMLSRRITSAEPDMDLLKENEYITRPEKCCIKRVKRNMDNTHPFVRDGITTGDTESHRQKLDGQRAIIMLHDRIALENRSYVATRTERLRNAEHWILKLNQGGAQQPLNQTTRLCSSEKRMQGITRRICGKDSTGI